MLLTRVKGNELIRPFGRVFKEVLTSELSGKQIHS